MVDPPITSFGRKPKYCPSCRHTPVADIVYGLVSLDEELNQQLEAGLVTLGGCCVSDNDPAWECSQCGWQGWRIRKKKQD
jgi:hypothetical protein